MGVVEPRVKLAEIIVICSQFHLLRQFVFVCLETREAELSEQCCQLRDFTVKNDVRGDSHLSLSQKQFDQVFVLMFVKHVVLSCCILLYGCEVILRNSFQPLTDVFEQEPFLMTKDQTTNLITCFFVGYGILQIPAGLLLQVVSSEITLIVPVFFSGICAQLLVLCESYSQLLAIRFFIGVSQASCFLSTLCIIQQYFSLKQLSFYSGLLLLIGNIASTFNILQTHLLSEHQIWKSPLFAIGLSMQCLCIILSIIYIAERKRTISKIKIIHRQMDNVDTSTGTSPWSEISESQMSECDRIKSMKSWKLWFIPRDQLVAHKRLLASCSLQETECSKITIGSRTPSDVSVDVSVDDEKQSESSLKSDVNSVVVCRSYRERAMSALSNRYTYLFAAVYGLLCISPFILGCMWFKKYLTTKWSSKCDGKLTIEEHEGQIINVMGFLGAGIGSLLFGWITRRFHDSNPFIHRQLCTLGFLLQGIILLVVYIPEQYHSYWGLLICTFVSGMGAGAICVIFTGTREANVATQSSDVASAIIGTICVGVISLSGFVFGKILKTVQGECIAGHKTTESEFNKAFLFVAVAICLGMIASCFVPRNDKK